MRSIVVSCILMENAEKLYCVGCESKHFFVLVALLVLKSSAIDWKCKSICCKLEGEVCACPERWLYAKLYLCWNLGPNVVFENK